MARTNREIIEAWQRQDDREDDEAFEGRIGENTLPTFFAYLCRPNI
jgi:hypothetical protein